MPKIPRTTPFTIGQTQPLLPSRYNAAGESMILWKWNQTDLTQFDSLIQYGTGASSVAFATDFPGNVTGLPCIKFTGTTAGSVPRAVLPIKASEVTMPDKFWVYVVIDESADTGGGIVYAYQDSTHWLGLTVQFGGPAVAHTVADNATPVDSPTDFGTGSSTKYGAGGEQWRDARLLVQIEYPASAPPGVSAAWQSDRELYTTTSNGRTSASANWSSGWDAANARQAALQFVFTGNNQVARIRSAVIIKALNDI